MTEILTLGDGTELYGWAEEHGGRLSVFIHGLALGEARALLEDPERTGRIVSARNDGIREYAGFTRLTEIAEACALLTAATLEREAE